MPFGLKNVKATFQRLINKVFAEWIGKNVETYVDDLAVKSLKAKDHMKDLDELFRVLRKYEVKLNLEKYMFRAVTGKFWGSCYLIEELKPIWRRLKQSYKCWLPVHLKLCKDL